jgi:hypothetical protein
MKQLSQSEFNILMSLSTISPRLKKEVRFIKSTEHIEDNEWGLREIIPIFDRSGTKGVLIVSINGLYSLVGFERKSGIVSATTGRPQTVICDFCKTWQSGTRSGSISFTVSRDRTVTYLCCEDLACSLHVRNLTNASKTSRSQLREDLSVEQRVDRLRSRLMQLIEALQLGQYPESTLVH